MAATLSSRLFQAGRRMAPRSIFRRSISTTPCATDGLKEHLQEIIKESKESGTFKVERVITSSQSSYVGVEGSGRADRSILNMCANNYLGLSDNPEIVQAAKDTLDTHGFGLSSVRFICGTQDLHKRLERAIADFHGMEDVILYPSCFDANAGLFEAILGPDDAIISDTLNHASIIDGVRLCKAQRHRFAHMDMKDLEEKLKATQDCRTRLIATDGVFSMDGDVAPLKEICDLAAKYDARVFVDECHATGFMGETGRGTDEYCGVTGKIDIINSTLGKALGGATGGYTAASQDVVDVLRQRSRPYLFSNSLAPSVAGASLKVFEMLTQDNSRVQDIQKKSIYFRTKLQELGFEVAGAKEHPICPVMLGDARLASEFADEMFKRGIYVVGFSFPVVPRGQARIRTQVSAAHSYEDLNCAIDAFAEVGRAKGCIN